MHAEVVFVAGYAVFLLGLAWLLARLGRVNTDPWSSRALAGYRAQAAEVPDRAEAQDWPHSEVPRLHTGLAVVATAAATLLPVAEAFRHHAPAELALLGPVACTGLAFGVHLMRRLAR